MTLESLANLSEFIGAIAVVISLIYLALQVRQNTAAQRMETYAQAVQRIGMLQTEVSKDHELLRAWSKGLMDPDSLTPNQRMQLNWTLYAAFGDMEFLFIAAKRNALPDEVWERWQKTLAWWIAFPGVRAWWVALAAPFTAEFSRFVDAEVANSTADMPAILRFNDFIIEGTAALRPEERSST